MNDFHDPILMASAAQVQSSVVKFWHATGGLFIWEFLTTLDYESRVIRGCFPYRWTIWIYSLARVAALVGVILTFVGMDVTTPIDCQLWYLFAAISFCLSAISASLLIVLRTIAIWNRNKVVVTLSITVLGISIAFHLQNIARLHSAWDPALRACEPVKVHYSVLGFIPSIIADMALLLIILAGLFIMRRGGGTFGLTHLLWKQGIIWLILGAVAEVPPLVFTMLHMNDLLCNTFETPSVIVMTIAATRMHRSLVDFASGSSDMIHENLQVSSLVFAKTKRKDAPSIALDRIEVVTVNKACEQHPKVPMGDGADGDSSTTISTAFTCPLPAISLSPILQTQSV